MLIKAEGIDVDLSMLELILSHSDLLKCLRALV